MHRLLPVFLLALIALMLGQSGLPPAFGPGGGIVAITATPVALSPHNAKVRRVGDLTILHGWALTSHSTKFDELSALRAWHGRWLAVMDTGALALFLRGDPGGRIVSLSPRCRPNRVRMGRDVEGMYTDGRSIWISAEWRNTICRRDPNGEQTGVRPAVMTDWPRSSGAETLLMLRDGRFW